MHYVGRSFLNNLQRLWFVAIYFLCCIVIYQRIHKYVDSLQKELPEKRSELPMKYEDYCILPNVFNNTIDDYNRITQILHMSANYLDERLIEQVENWDAPVSLSVVLLRPEQFNCVVTRLNQMVNSNPLLFRFLRVHLVFPIAWSPTCSDLPLIYQKCNQVKPTIDDIANYPANLARNAARMFSSSKYILIADYEHLFSKGFEEDVRKVADKAIQEGEKKYLVYRIFEIRKNATAPENKEDLEKMMQTGDAVVFHSVFYKGAHDISGREEWFAENGSTTGISHKNFKYDKSTWEPQFVSRSDIPLHDTSFPFLVRDNTVLRWEMCRMGYTMDILSNHFMYHKGIKTKKSLSVSRPIQNKNWPRYKTALDNFNKRMDSDFPDKNGRCPDFLG